MTKTYVLYYKLVDEKSSGKIPDFENLSHKDIKNEGWEILRKYRYLRGWDGYDVIMEKLHDKILSVSDLKNLLEGYLSGMSAVDVLCGINFENPGAGFFDVEISEENIKVYMAIEVLTTLIRDLSSSDKTYVWCRYGGEF